ncbi:glycoside hydrolase family 99-like domain-containing protein [Muribaculum gordoncarteri]|uniref:glycoside hydrolase family 99-like domain-containing protein n=1 Tax=Muribaculum gordoncarteri TaxID=2530390 RepID=UPI003F66498F
MSYISTQYHPFKENDEWWGKGFTELTNVTKITSKFPDIPNSNLPSDLRSDS